VQTTVRGYEKDNTHKVLEHLLYRLHCLSRRDRFSRLLILPLLGHRVKHARPPAHAEEDACAVGSSHGASLAVAVRCASMQCTRAWYTYASWSNSLTLFLPECPAGRSFDIGAARQSSAMRGAPSKPAGSLRARLACDGALSVAHRTMNTGASRDCAQESGITRLARP